MNLKLRRSKHLRRSRLTKRERLKYTNKSLKNTHTQTLISTNALESSSVRSSNVRTFGKLQHLQFV